MIVLIDGVKYILVAPENEADLEKRIEENYRQIFGEKAIYFPKKKIRSKAGIGTIPDAFLILPDQKLKWCILEVELASHPVYDHVFPQLTKFRRAIEDSTSRKKITEFFYDNIKSDEVLEAQFRKQIGTGEIYKSISDMVNEKPLIVVAIDEKTGELEEALLDFGGDVKVIEFKTYRRQGSSEIYAYMFEPVITPGKGDKARAGSEPRENKGTGTRKRGRGIKNAIYALFDEKGADGVSYEEAEQLAKSIKANTKFNQNHFSWYKRDYGRKRKVNVPEKEKRHYVSYRDECVERISRHLGERLVKDGKVAYSTPNGSSKIICLVSKTYENKSKEKKSYWYGFLKSHKEVLSAHKMGYAAFGCGSAAKIILVPIGKLVPLLRNMNKTEQGDGFYWHVKIHEENGRFSVEQPLADEMVDITEYVMK